MSFSNSPNDPGLQFIAIPSSTGQHGTFGGRPIQGRFPGDIWYVDSGPGQGITYVWSGSIWELVGYGGNFAQALGASAGQVGSTFGVPGDEHPKHLVIFGGYIFTGGATTGGALTLQYTANSLLQSFTLDPGTKASGATFPLQGGVVTPDASTTFSVQQTALSSGAVNCNFTCSVI